jgi:hypothetical protein
VYFTLISSRNLIWTHASLSSTRLMKQITSYYDSGLDLQRIHIFAIGQLSCDWEMKTVCSHLFSIIAGQSRPGATSTSSETKSEGVGVETITLIREAHWTGITTNSPLVLVQGRRLCWTFVRTHIPHTNTSSAAVPTGGSCSRGPAKTLAKKTYVRVSLSECKARHSTLSGRSERGPYSSRTRDGQVIKSE